MPSFITIDVQCDRCQYHDERLLDRAIVVATGDNQAPCAEPGCGGNLKRLPSAPAIPPEGFIMGRSTRRTRAIRDELATHRLEYAAKDGETGAAEAYVDFAKHKAKEGNGL